MDMDDGDGHPPETGPRIVKIQKSHLGFGFNVRGQVQEGGTLKSIGGELYAPMQYISAVLEEGPATDAGLKVGDFILEVNGVNVEGATHRSVVELIRAGGDCLVLTVVSPQNSHMVNPNSYQRGSNENNGSQYISRRIPEVGGSPDLSERRSLPLTIPDWKRIQAGSDKFVIFKVFMAGRHLVSRRFSEFVTLHNMLKSAFPDLILPPLPSKWPFSLSDQQLDSRRRGLEVYLERVCSFRAISESPFVQRFLCPSAGSLDSDAPPSQEADELELKVLLPGATMILLTARHSESAASLYARLAKEMGLNGGPDHANPQEPRTHFFLYELVEPMFCRRLEPTEPVHAVYASNYTLPLQTCIAVRCCCITKRVLLAMAKRDSVAANLILTQLKEDAKQRQQRRLKKNKTSVAKNSNLQADLIENSTAHGAVKEIIHLLNENPRRPPVVIRFPPCGCDSKRAPTVVVEISERALVLIDATSRGQTDDGGEVGDVEVNDSDWSESSDDEQQSEKTTTKRKRVEFTWDRVLKVAVASSGNAATVTVIVTPGSEGKERKRAVERSVQVFTPYAHYFADCCRRVRAELLLEIDGVKGTLAPPATNSKKNDNNLQEDEENGKHEQTATQSDENDTNIDA